MRPVAAVHADDRGLVAVSLRERRRTTERLGPVGRQSLGVLRVEPVAEGVAHHLVGQHPLVPGVREPEQTRVAAGRREDRQMRPCSIASSTHGTTMSSISSSDVVASKPRTSRAFSTDGHALLHVVVEGVVAHVVERLVAVEPLPDVLGELEHGGRLGGRQVEVLVERGRVLHGVDDAARQVAAVGVVAHLVALAEDVERVLALGDLLDEVGHHVAHRELHVAALDLDLGLGPHLAGADAVERPHDRVRQPVLRVRGARRSTRPRASGSRTTRSAAGPRCSCPSYDGHESVDSNTIDELMYVTFCSRPSRCAAMAASHDDAMMRSLVARRSYANVWK